LEDPAIAHAQTGRVAVCILPRGVAALYVGVPVARLFSFRFNQKKKMTSKIPCQQCGVNIEFDLENANQFVDCPSCNQKTRLIVPAKHLAIATGQKMKHDPRDDDGQSAISIALIIFAGLEFVSGLFAGIFFLTRQREENIVPGITILIAGISSGLILLGFAALIEHSKASAVRLKRIEIWIQKAVSMKENA
jgi:hypothetical protein